MKKVVLGFVMLGLVAGIFAYAAALAVSRVERAHLRDEVELIDSIKTTDAPSPTAPKVVEDSIAGMIVIVERPPKRGMEYPIHYVIFFSKDGRLVIASREDFAGSAALRDVYTTQLALHHDVTIDVAPLFHADQVCS